MLELRKNAKIVLIGTVHQVNCYLSLPISEFTPELLFSRSKIPGKG